MAAKGVGGGGATEGGYVVRMGVADEAWSLF